MIRNCIFLVIFFFSSILFATTEKRKLSLSDAVGIALKNNPEIKSLKANHNLSQIKFKLDNLALFLPEVNLITTIGVDGAVGKTDSTSSGEIGTTNSFVPGQQKQAGITLEIGGISLFNSWRDKDQLDIQKVNNENTKIAFTSSLRTFMFNIIQTYFLVVSKQSNVQTAREKVIFAKSFLDLAKNKAKIRVGNNFEADDEYLFAMKELLDAERNLSATKFELRVAEMQLNDFLFEELEQEYIYTTKMKYVPIKLTYKDLESQIENAPTLIQEKNNLDIQEKTMRVAGKSRLPLPKLSLSGYSVGRSYTDTTATNSYGFGGRSKSNIDLKAEVNWTLPLWGANGFLGKFTYEQAKVGYMTAQYGVEKARRALKSKFYTLVNQIASQEEQIENAKVSLENASKLLDSVLKKFKAGTATRIEIKDSLDNLSSINDTYSNALYSYLGHRITIATDLGYDTLYGDLKTNKKIVEEVDKGSL